ncbi:hypothetical protein AWENTII_011880 [Aspergillus wentii]|nr:hypothetical protein MW887_008368 [Aspergillus wentii]
MQFTNIILALMASSMVMAAPAQDSGSSTDSAAVSCPSGWIQCGECNGTSCKVAGTNRKCRTGSCTKQSGAGDGAICGSSDLSIDMDCPGGRN